MEKKKEKKPKTLHRKLTKTGVELGWSWRARRVWGYQRGYQNQ